MIHSGLSNSTVHNSTVHNSTVHNSTVHNFSVHKCMQFFCVFVFFLSFLSLSTFSNAQETQYEDYNHTGRPQHNESRAQEIVGENIDRAFEKINEYVQRHGNEIAVIPDERGDREERFGHDSPERNPLDIRGGKLGRVQSWHEYMSDSRTLLNVETFPVCLEPRIIARRGNFFLNAMNPALASTCRAHCPPLLFYDQDWMVVSYYWPETVMSVNRAGAQMIDPAIVDENMGFELSRMMTSIKEDFTETDRNRIEQINLLRRMGVRMELFRNPDYRTAPREFHLRQQGTLRYPRAMRPNAFWRAADARPASILGYGLNRSCFLDALDPPTGFKRVVRSSFDQGRYAVLARYPELRRRVDEERSSMTEDYRNLEAFRNDYSGTLNTPCAGWRLDSNPEVYGELSRIGVQPVRGPRYKDYCLPGGGELSGSMVQNHRAPRLQADAARAVMAAIWFSSDKGPFRDFNPENRRMSKFSLYRNRDWIPRPRYVGLSVNPSENRSNIVFADKLQRVYPTQYIGGNQDAIGAPSSKTIRQVIGTRGSHCFRPEDIPNWSSVDEVTKNEWPLGLMRDSSHNYEETRWAIWNQRIFCACEVISFSGTGCVTLNSGDHEEVPFAGIPIVAGKLPEPLEEGIKRVRGLATRQGKPSNSMRRGLDTIDLNAATLDTGFPMFTYPIVPLQSEEVEELPPSSSIDNTFICILPEDKNPSQSGNGGQAGGGQPGGGTPGTNPPTGGGAAPNPPPRPPPTFPGFGGGGPPT